MIYKQTKSCFLLWLWLCSFLFGAKPVEAQETRLRKRRTPLEAARNQHQQKRILTELKEGTFSPPLPEILKTPSLWKSGARVSTTYKDKAFQKIITQVAQKQQEALPGLLISTVVTDQKGHIVFEDGGDFALDGASISKPVVGSTMKTIVFAAAGSWPSSLPLLNAGTKTLTSCSEKCSSFRGFRLFRTTHNVRNASKMKAFLSKDEALAASANIASVYLSLRYTWLLSEDEWKAALEKALTAWIEDTSPELTKEERQREVALLISEPKTLLQFLIAQGLKKYISKQAATFEFAKARFVRQNLGSDNEMNKILAVLLDMNFKEFQGHSKLITEDKRLLIAKALSSKRQLTEAEIIAWSPEIRKFVGLYALAYWTREILGNDQGSVRPTITLALGSNNASTRGLARLSHFLNHGELRHPFSVQVLRYKGVVHQRTEKAHRLPLETTKVKRAMHQTILFGTASPARKYCAASLLPKVGAKTGTTQNSRGVLCIGFLGEFSGALTISMPNNEILEYFRPKRVPRIKKLAKTIGKQNKRCQTMQQSLQKRMPQWRKNTLRRKYARCQKSLKKLLKKKEFILKKQRFYKAFLDRFLPARSSYNKREAVRKKFKRRCATKQKRRRRKIRQKRRRRKMSKRFSRIPSRQQARKRKMCQKLKKKIFELSKDLPSPKTFIKDNAFLKRHFIRNKIKSSQACVMLFKTLTTIHQELSREKL